MIPAGYWLSLSVLLSHTFIKQSSEPVYIILDWSLFAHYTELMSSVWADTNSVIFSVPISKTASLPLLAPNIILSESELNLTDIIDGESSQPPCVGSFG